MSIFDNNWTVDKTNSDTKQYAEAEQAFKKATELDPNQRWYWNGLYDVYYTTKNYQKSISVVQKLIEFDENLKEALKNTKMDSPCVIECIIDMDEMVYPMIPPGESIKKIVLKGD